MRFSLLAFLLVFSVPALSGEPEWLKAIETPAAKEPSHDDCKECVDGEDCVSFLGEDDGVKLIPFSDPSVDSTSMVEVRFSGVKKILFLPLFKYRQGLDRPDVMGIAGAVRVPLGMRVYSVGGVEASSLGSFVSAGSKVYEGRAGNWSLYECHYDGYKIMGVFRDDSSLGVLPRENGRLRQIEGFDAPIEQEEEVALGDDWIATKLVVYSASWCGPCQRVKPKFKQLIKLGYRVEIRDYDKIPKGEYRPRSVPEIHLFNGKKRVEKKEHGLSPFSSIDQFKKKLELPASGEEA